MDKLFWYYDYFDADLEDYEIEYCTTIYPHKAHDIYYMITRFDNYKTDEKKIMNLLTKNNFPYDHVFKPKKKIIVYIRPDINYLSIPKDKYINEYIFENFIVNKHIYRDVVNHILTNYIKTLHAHGCECDTCKRCLNYDIYIDPRARKNIHHDSFDFITIGDTKLSLQDCKESGKPETHD